MVPSSTSDEPELDVRPLPKPEKHPRIFATYDALPVGGSFVLVNDHYPRHLQEEFETEHAGTYDWQKVSAEPRLHRVRIRKLASTTLPRVLVQTRAVVDGAHLDPDAAGALWRLDVRERDLDANVVSIPADAEVASHQGPDLDVLVHVLAGSGRVATETGSEITLEPGMLVWLPRRSRRAFRAGHDGLRYLTVHQRRQALVIEPGVRRAD